MENVRIHMNVQQGADVTSSRNGLCYFSVLPLAGTNDLTIDLSAGTSA